jgi:hypothetical protein
MKTAALLLTALAAAAIVAGTATARPPIPQHVSGSLKASPKLVAVFQHRHLSSSAGAWVPGQAYLITETDAQNALERGYDHVFCTGVARFGHSNDEWPDEEFHVFDCSVEINQTICPGARYAAVKATRRNYFRLDRIRLGNCY